MSNLMVWLPSSVIGAAENTFKEQYRRLKGLICPIMETIIAFMVVLLLIVLVIQDKGRR